MFYPLNYKGMSQRETSRTSLNDPKARRHKILSGQTPGQLLKDVGLLVVKINTDHRGHEDGGDNQRHDQVFAAFLGKIHSLS